MTSEPLDRCLATFDKGAIVATLQSFPTTLTVPGGAGVAVGALTAVSCRATHRRQGLLTRMIGDDLRSSRDRGEPADILIAAEYPIYGRFGYGPATQRTDWEVDVKAASFSDPGGGSVEFVDNDTFRKEAPGIFEQVRVGRPGHDRARRLRLGRQGGSATPAGGQAVAGLPPAVPRRGGRRPGVRQLHGEGQVGRLPSAVDGRGVGAVRRGPERGSTVVAVPRPSSTSSPRSRPPIARSTSCCRGCSSTVGRRRRRRATTSCGSAPWTSRRCSPRGPTRQPVASSSRSSTTRVSPVARSCSRSRRTVRAARRRRRAPT